MIYSQTIYNKSPLTHPVGIMLLSMVDRILEFLNDGRWHDFEEISSNFHLHESDVEVILSFLIKYDFITSDIERKRVKINSLLLELFQNINC